jgi:NAD(P)-dependent dehydrogenase (short-subunit alcohol dehydrogenase family)
MTKRVVMLTGAAGNLGRAVVAAFGEDGDTLVLVDRSRESLAAAHGAESAERVFAVANLLTPGEVDAVAQGVLQKHGRIDVLCNIAGGFRMGEAVHETTAATWDLLVDLNARSIVHTAHAVVPAMLAQGRGWIVNIGAHSAQRGTAQMGAYVASKSMVARLTESMAAELRERGINVNCVLPSTLDTPENRQSMPQTDPARWVAPADLAAVIRFLATEAARAVHGASVPVVGLS